MTSTTRTPATASAYKPRRRKTSADTQDPLVEHITAQVMQGRKLLTQEDFLDVMKSVAKRLLETTLNAELGHHLDGKSVAAGIDDDNQEEEEAAPRPKNKRNGSTPKTVRTPFGELDIRTPRDRLGTFEPMLVPKRSRTMDKLNEQIIAMYWRGMTVREISAYLEDLYGIDVSAEFISNATESVLEDVNEWQSRPWRASIRWCFSTPCASRSATAAASRTWLCIWRSAWTVTAVATCSACGWPRTRAQRSGRMFSAV